MGTLGEMLAQKELQLTGLQEERDSLQVERDNLMRELQLYRELEEAQVVMVGAEDFESSWQNYSHFNSLILSCAAQTLLCFVGCLSDSSSQSCTKV